MAEEILNLSTIVDRPTINITSKRFPKGKSYELVNLADLGPYEYAIVFQRNEEMQPLLNTKNPSQAQVRKLKKLLDDTIKMICPQLEPAVLAELTDQQKQMLATVWAAKVREGAAEGNTTGRRTTAGSSRGSKRSTAATPKSGSTSRRGS